MLWHRLAGATSAVKNLKFVGSKTAVLNDGRSLTTSLTDLTGGIGSSPIENDIVIVFYANAFDGLATGLSFVTSGYTSIANIGAAADKYDIGLLAGYKIMGPTPDTDVSATFSGGSSGEDTTAMAIFVFRNINTTTPLDVTSTTATGTNSLRPNPPAITPTTDGAIIISCGAGSIQEALRTYSSGDLSNFITATADSYNNAVIGAGTYAWTSGVFNPATFTLNGGADTDESSWAAVTLALRPA